MCAHCEYMKCYFKPILNYFHLLSRGINLKCFTVLNALRCDGIFVMDASAVNIDYGVQIQFGVSVWTSCASFFL